MREILFRGKRKDNGKFVYGFLVMNKCSTRENGRLIYYTRPEIIPIGEIGEADYDGDGNYYEYVVIPETVGQYTGLTDKNGKKIFEGDIVAIDHTRRTTFWSEIPETYRPRNSYSVHWDEEKDEINYKRNYAVEWKKKDARWILRNGSDQHDLRDVFIHFHNGIIIGNIHDNPELLKGGGEGC